MKVKTKTCSGCGLEKVIWKNHKGEKFCKTCWMQQAPVKFKQPSRSIKAVSEKKRLQDQIYSQLRVKFLEQYPFCQAHLYDICTKNATDIHHKAGRGEYYLNQATWLSVCRSCHEWIERNPTESKELGFSVSRLSDHEMDI